VKFVSLHEFGSLTRNARRDGTKLELMCLCVLNKNRCRLLGIILGFWTSLKSFFARAEFQLTLPHYFTLYDSPTTFCLRYRHHTVGFAQIRIRIISRIEKEVCTVANDRNLTPGMFHHIADRRDPGLPFCPFGPVKPEFAQPERPCLCESRDPSLSFLMILRFSVIV
jgi:hypothetical protein